MSRNKSVLAVLVVCCFRLFTAFLIKDEREFKGTSFNVLTEYRKGGTRKNQTLANGGDVPPAFDWRANGGVSPVKDQKQCSACWAFSAVAAIESQWKIHNRGFILSEQFLIDCNHLNAGCQSGNLLKTYGDIASLLTGVMEEGNYRQYDESRRNCEWNGDTGPLIPVTGFRRVKPRNEVDMVTYLYHNGPLSAGFNDATMKFYNFNVNDPIDRPTVDSCPNEIDDLNHAVLIVGYDVYRNNDGTLVPYWIIKNSWGSAWGDGGYYYLERGINACGIAQDVIFPFVP